MYYNREKIVLASKSPRRKKFLEEMGLSFTAESVEIDEQPAAGEDPGHFVIRMAREKSAPVAENFPDRVIIGGDTVVCLGTRILGKPFDEGDAVQQLMSLSGKWHEVMSGFTVLHQNKKLSVSQVVTTRVLFSDFSIQLARAYVAAGESHDKAGSYGIQGKGVFLVEAVEGSYSNVVGLPVYELTEVLLKYGIIDIVEQSGA